MDAAVRDKVDVGAPISRGARVALLGIVLIVVALSLIDPASLVDPIPPPLTVMSAAAGLAGGIWLSLRMRFPSYMGAIRRALGRMAAPIFGAMIATFFARVGVEAAGFVGLNPAETHIQAHVLSRGLERSGGQFAQVYFGPGTRSVYVEISSDLYDQLDPIRAPGRDCIVLSIQTGRFGLRRTMLPRRFFEDPIGEDHYRRCRP
jgi:hypothetical protein